MTSPSAKPISSFSFRDLLNEDLFFPSETRTKVHEPNQEFESEEKDQKALVKSEAALIGAPSLPFDFAGSFEKACRLYPFLRQSLINCRLQSEAVATGSKFLKKEPLDVKEEIKFGVVAKDSSAELLDCFTTTYQNWLSAGMVYYANMHYLSQCSPIHGIALVITKML